MDRARRYERQRILPEVGDHGQSRIEASACHVPDDAPEVTRAAALLYASAAGLRVERGPEPQQAGPDLFPHSSHYRHDVAERTARGIHLAHEALRRALALSPPSPPSSPR